MGKGSSINGPDDNINENYSIGNGDPIGNEDSVGNEGSIGSGGSIGKKDRVNKKDITVKHDNVEKQDSINKTHSNPKDNCIEKIIELSADSRTYVNEPLSGHTSFRIGGPADILVCPESIDTIVKVTTFCRKNRIPYYVIGNGTNLLISDRGIRGVTLRLGGQINQLRSDKNKITAGAGTSINDLARFACENGLSGLEFLYGIPGTVGGAVTMNAGAYGREMKDVVYRTVFLDGKGNIGVLDAESHEFGYRESCFQHRKCVVLEVEFVNLEPGDPKTIKLVMDGYMNRRIQSQPLDFPSAGSVFRRPENGFAGAMIEGCALKGYQIGGAKIAEKHAGFIVNIGGATAKDVYDLIAHIKRQVKKKYSVSLTTEIKMIGERM